MDYRLVGGQAAGGEDRFFDDKAQEAALDAFQGRGFMVVDPDDRFRRAFGHVRIGPSAMDEVSRARTVGQSPRRWSYRGVVYEGENSATEERLVHIVGYSFGGGGVRASVVEAPPAREQTTT